MVHPLAAAAAVAWACLLPRHALGERVHTHLSLEVAPGPDDAVFLGRHNLWTDKVVFRRDKTFYRETYPDEHGTWAVRGKTLMMVWEGWGQVTLWTEDEGLNLWKYGFWLEPEHVPDWWRACFRAEAALAPAAPRTTSVEWSMKDKLPLNEGYDMPGYPTDLTSVQECRKWCEASSDCIGFVADVESDVVKAWAPKQMRTGFDPESAEWLSDKRSGEGELQFHWKADDESLKRNDDGSTALLRCPAGLTQNLKHNYQCQSPDGVSLNKDGTINFEQLMLEQMSSAWDELAQPPGEREPTAWQKVKEHLIQEGWDFAKAKLIAGGLAAATSLAGKGGAIGVIAHVLAKSWVVWGHAAQAPLIPLTALVAYYKYLDDWHWALIASQKRVAGLLFKSSCAQEARWDGGVLRREHLRDDLEGECGAPVVDGLLDQLPRTLSAMKQMFAALESIAWCMRGGAVGLGEGWKSGVSCSAEVIPRLRGTNGRPGVLTAALMASWIYAQQTDSLFKEANDPSIRAKLRTAFLTTTDYRDLGHVKVPPVLDSLPALVPEQKQMACANLLVSQVSYERIFLQLSRAFQVWTRTFGVDDATQWFSSPCRELFSDMAVPAAPMCLEPGSTAYLGSGSTCSKGRDVDLFGE